MRAAMRRRIHEMSVARIGENADGPGLSRDPGTSARTG